MHEYTHAWRFHVPPPRGEEELAQFVAFISPQFQSDLDRQGGEAALEQLPMKRVDHLTRAVEDKTPRDPRENPGGRMPRRQFN